MVVSCDIYVTHSHIALGVANEWPCVYMCIVLTLCSHNASCFSIADDLLWWTGDNLGFTVSVCHSNTMYIVTQHLNSHTYIHVLCTCTVMVTCQICYNYIIVISEH